MGERKRERETQNPKQAPGSELSPQSPTQGSNSRTVRSDHDLSRSRMLNRLSHPGAPDTTDDLNHTKAQLEEASKNHSNPVFMRKREKKIGRHSARSARTPTSNYCIPGGGKRC